VGKIGSFGGVTFEVSHNKIVTFDDFSRSGDARWSEHDVMNRKPISEFLGPGQESVSYVLTLKRSLGADPEAVVKTLRSFRDNGKVGTFVIGSKPISSNYWYIASLQEKDPLIDGKGRVHEREVTVNLKEYTKTATIQSKKKPKPKAKAKKKSSASKKKKLGTITIKVGMLNCRASRSLKGKILKVLRKGQKFPVYGVKKTDVKWYDLGGGKYCSAEDPYTSLKKG